MLYPEVKTEPNSFLMEEEEKGAVKLESCSSFVCKPEPVHTHIHHEDLHTHIVVLKTEPEPLEISHTAQTHPDGHTPVPCIKKCSVMVVDFRKSGIAPVTKEPSPRTEKEDDESNKDDDDYNPAGKF